VALLGLMISHSCGMLSCCCEGKKDVNVAIGSWLDNRQESIDRAIRGKDKRRRRVSYRSSK